MKTMFTPAQAKTGDSGNDDFIDTGTEIVIVQPADVVFALAHNNIGFAFTATVEANPHLPFANTLAVDDRIGRHIQVLDVQSVAAAASVTSVRRKTVRPT